VAVATTDLLDQLASGLEIDESRMQRDRLARARDQLRRHGLAAALLFDPLNVRYTTTVGIGIVSNLHYSWRWALVPVDSDPVLWEYRDAIDTVRERWPEGDFRPASDWHCFSSGSRDVDDARAFAAEIMSELAERGIEKEIIGVDRLETVAFLALQDSGMRIADAQRPLELARAVKTPDEIEAMRFSARVCDAAIDELRAQMKPGRTENELWAIFAGTAMKLGAEYCEFRQLLSGPRTNPWMREASNRVIDDGDLVAFDTDLVGPRGYLTDISRTYLCGSATPSDEHRRLHTIAYEFLHTNISQFRPGTSFVELGERLGKKLPGEFHPQHYPFIAHGSGMADEYPGIMYTNNYPGEVEANMVLSVEAYIGALGAREGVKLEEQILVTAEGYEVFSRTPYDEQLL
jgi:Xaa-Pro dipeptidase